MTARGHKKQDINMTGIVDEYNYLILKFQFKLLRSNKRKKLKTLPANRIQLTVPVTVQNLHLLWKVKINVICEVKMVWILDIAIV